MHQQSVQYTARIVFFSVFLFCVLAFKAGAEQSPLLGRGTYEKKRVQVKRFGTGDGGITTGKDEATGKKVIRVEPAPKAEETEQETPPIFVYPEVEYRTKTPERKKTRTIPKAPAQ